MHTTVLTTANFIRAIQAVTLQVTVEGSWDTLISRFALELMIPAWRTYSEYKPTSINTHTQGPFYGLVLCYSAKFQKVVILLLSKLKKATSILTDPLG